MLRLEGRRPPVCSYFFFVCCPGCDEATSEPRKLGPKWCGVSRVRSMEDRKTKKTRQPVTRDPRPSRPRGLALSQSGARAPMTCTSRSTEEQTTPTYRERGLVEVVAFRAMASPVAPSWPIGRAVGRPSCTSHPPQFVFPASPRTRCGQTPTETHSISQLCT